MFFQFIIASFLNKFGGLNATLLISEILNAFILFISAFLGSCLLKFFFRLRKGSVITISYMALAFALLAPILITQKFPVLPILLNIAAIYLALRLSFVRDVSE